MIGSDWVSFLANGTLPGGYQSMTSSTVEEQEKGKKNWKVALFLGSVSLIVAAVIILLVARTRGKASVNKASSVREGGAQTGGNKETNTAPLVQSSSTENAVPSPSGGGGVVQVKSAGGNESANIVGGGEGDVGEGAKNIVKGTDGSLMPKANNNDVSEGTKSTDPSKSGPAIEPSTSLPVSIPFPISVISPISDETKKDIMEVTKHINDPAAFSAALIELKRIAGSYNTNLKGLEKENHGDNLVEKYMRIEVLNQVLKGDSQATTQALEAYHKAVQQTKAVAILPLDVKNIKEINLYEIVRKCVNEGTLSLADKVKLQDILLSPTKLFTFNVEEAMFLGRKIEGSSAEEAVNTIKTFFTGPDEVKKMFKKYVSFCIASTEYAEHDENEEALHLNSPEYLEFLKELPSELKDENFKRTDVKESLLKVLAASPALDLTKIIERDELPTIASIKATIASFPADDLHLLGYFAKRLIAYVRVTGQARKTAQKNGSDLKNFCLFLLLKHVYRAQFTPEDTRITNLVEWKAYLDNPYSCNTMAKLFKAVSDMGIDPDCLHQYVMKTLHMGYLQVHDYGPHFPSILLALFRFSFKDQPEHPYYKMREALFDLSNEACRKAIEAYISNPIDDFVTKLREYVLIGRISMPKGNSREELHMKW